MNAIDIGYRLDTYEDITMLTTPPQQREKINPIYGISAEGYQGPGFVQSPPAEKS